MYEYFFSFYCYVTKTYVTSIREPPIYISQPSQLGNNSDFKTFLYNTKKVSCSPQAQPEGPEPSCWQTLHGYQTEQKQCCSTATRWQFNPLKDSRDDVYGTNAALSLFTWHEHCSITNICIASYKINPSKLQKSSKLTFVVFVTAILREFCSGSIEKKGNRKGLRE